MVDPAPPPSDREALAAELALGLLDGPEWAEALRLCLSDPEFGAEVGAWSLRLSLLLDAVPAV
jgi:anti-sigma-K factor RskA